MTNAAIEYHLSTPTDLFIRNKLIVRIPIELDFNNEEAKSAIYESWRRERNLPYSYMELREKIAKLKDLRKSAGYFELNLTQTRKGCFVSIILSGVPEKRKEIETFLKDVFGSNVISY